MFLKETILKHFQEIKASIEKDLDKAVKVSASQSEIDRLLDNWTEINNAIMKLLKSN
jgi:uncharacterized protein YggL (DUF469 family)